jgi:hypothetical protein
MSRAGDRPFARANGRAVGRRGSRWDELQSAGTWRAAGVELIATLLFVFLGGGLAALMYRFMFLTSAEAGPAPVSAKASRDSETILVSPVVDEADGLQGLPAEQMARLAFLAARARAAVE